MVEDFLQGEEAIDNDEEDVLIQFWEASIITTEDGRKYWELTTKNKPFYIIYDAGGYDGGLSSYRKESVCRTITVQDDDDDDDGGGGGVGVGGGGYEHKLQKSNRLQILISCVFRNKRPERSTSYYARHKYSNNDFAVSCGIGSSWYIPIYKTAGDYSGSPFGVMEYVSSCEEYLEKFRLYLGLTFCLTFFGQILEYAVLEMDQFLTVVCQKFPLPLAQYWVTTHPPTEPLRVMYQQSHTEMKNLNFLHKFKQACMEMRLNIDDEGLVGTAYRSHRTFFCNNIKELSITNQHLALYATYNMSIPCFIICLKGIFPESRDCVLEFFLPPQEMITYNHQNLLNSLLSTMKDHLPSYMIASGERLGQVLNVEVIDSSMHNEPQFLKLGEWKSSFPRHEYEGHPPHEPSHLWKLLFEEDEHVVEVCSTTNSSTGETSERAPACHNIAETIHLDKLEGETSVKFIEPQSLTTKSKRSKETIYNVGNAEEIDRATLETTLEVAIKHQKHNVAADRVNELVEEPPIVGIGYNMSNEDVRYTAFQISNFIPTTSLPQQVEEERTVLDTSAQNNRNILGIEKDNTTTPILNKTCQEVHKPERKIKPQEDISFESLREQFGRPLDDAAASFGVSRSTFKRICRGHGIKRWQYGKRTIGENISSNLRRKLDDEEASRRNFSHSGMPSLQDTSQHLNKMTVKATYRGITIRFELPDLSGIAELEDNVIERLHLERRSFSIKYQDDEDDWILIACDKDVQECMKISRSSKKSTIKLLIDPPINNHHAP